jgi:hypothetical protein
VTAVGRRPHRRTPDADVRPVAEQPQRGVEVQADPERRGVRAHVAPRGLEQAELLDAVHHQP